MRKFVKVVIMFLLIILFYNTNSFANTENATFKVSSGEGKENDEITLNISLENNSNFVSANFTLQYDSKKLEYIGYTKGEILENAAMQIVKNNATDGKIAIAYVSNPTEEHQTLAGDLVKIKFKIKSNISETIKTELLCTDLKNDAGENVSYNITQGSIEAIGDNVKEDEIIDKEQDSTNENISNSNGKEEIQEDTTQAKSDIPKAGLKNIVLYMTMLLIFIAVFYKKYSKLKDI